MQVSKPLIASALLLTSALGQTPNDPDFASQWALLNDGQPIVGINGTPGADVSALEAWSLFEPSVDVVVAIVGAGVDPHPEFADRLLEGYVTSLAGGDPYSTLDTTGHGTRVAGIIAAARNNGVGIAGVNDRVWILPIRAIAGNTGSERSVAEGIVTAVDAGAKIIVVPLQLYEGAMVLSEALEYAYENNVLVVAPTGHQPTLGVAYPAALQHCIAVASTDNQDQTAAFSSYGPQVYLAAPSVGIWSTRVGGGYGFETAPSSVWAAAYVAGVASLIRAHAPGLSSDRVEQILGESADDDAKNPGWDAYRGWGRVNAAEALRRTPRPALRFTHDEPPPTSIDADNPVLFSIRVVDRGERVQPGSVRFFYQPGGAESELVLPMTQNDDGRYRVSVPPPDCGTTIRYSFQAMGDGGSIQSDPFGGPDESYTAVALRRSEFFADDFELDKGWTTIIEGDATTGAWTRVIPVGTSAQPAYDRSPDGGRRCFVTGQHVSGDPGTNDVDFGPVRLLSPPFSLHEADAEVSYALWFSSTSGRTDSLEVEFSRDGGQTWLIVESITSTTAGWEDRSFRLSDFPATQGDTLRLRFTTSDLDNDSLTEAAIDEVRVVELRCAARRGDLDNDGDIDLQDARVWADCVSGPTTSPASDRCLGLSGDGDTDVDLKDFQAVLNAFDGSLR